MMLAKHLKVGDVMSSADGRWTVMAVEAVDDRVQVRFRSPDHDRLRIETWPGDMELRVRG